MKNKSMLIRMILSYVLVGLLVMAGLTFIISAKVSSDLSQEINHSTDRAIEQSFNTASILLSSTFENYGTAFNNAEVQRGFYNQEFDTPTLGQIGNKLYELSSTNPLIQSIYLLNHSRKLAFSSLTTMKSYGEFYDPDALGLLDEVQPFRSGVFYPRHIHYSIYGKSYDLNVISLIYVSAIGHVNNGAMIINLDQKMLQSMVMNGAGSSSFQSMIINKHGIVISHTNDQMINANLSQENFVQKINGSGSTKGTLEMDSNGRKYHISYIKSDSLGWTFIGLVDYEQLLGKVNEVKRFLLTVTACMLLLVLLLGGFFTRLIYGPIHRLIQSIRNSPVGARERQPVSELDLLGGAFSYLEHRIQDLQLSIADYQSAKRAEVLRLLTTGGWTNDAEVRRKLAHVGIRFDYPGFLVCAIRLDGYRELRARYHPADIALFKYAVANIAFEVGGAHHLHLVCFDNGDDGVAMMINVPENMAELEQAVIQVLREIQQNVSLFLKLSINAAIGPEVPGMTGIKTSWEIAYNASRYKLVLGRGALIGADVEASREPLPDSQVAVLEKQMTDKLKLGDPGKIAAAAHEFMASVSKAPYDEMMLALTQLLIATARTVKTMGGSSPDDVRMDIGELSSQLGHMETMDEIERWYLSLCERAVRVRDREAAQKNKWMVDRVIQHIQEHYADPNLTVESLAEVGGLSMNYMRKVFKEMVGKSITVYLSEYRFSKAMELLVDTDLPANKIGEMVGFENTNYFYVSFKKHCGKTPDHYRKQHKFGHKEEPSSIPVINQT
ncbi:AraC family transcriptional regulator [Paenibacillus sp. OAS669]|uniref:AraC family transcriptional regulator n=1 Tax=Paenibacillus sp. OAS669 TaxID=2663821 RepID=UPI001A0AD785|nr:helix-turn-helix domain-containing protein [Paenibacillus sp. OAS669]MBE1446881.1 AraC-like DNA-binding protein [Paenibacillus sp. OAS669]